MEHAADPKTLLVEGMHAFGIRLSMAQIDTFQAYLSHLSAWNQRSNLTSIRDPALMVRRHLIDCASVTRYLDPAGHILDVGSGGGLPGIPIKILLPEKKVTLLESRRKRANFLRHVIRQLKLGDIRVLEQRIEALQTDHVDPLTETIARAFTDNEGFIRWSSRLLPPGGRCILMHGPQGLTFLEHIRSVLAALPFRVLPVQLFQLPFGGEQRTVLFFVRTRDGECFT